MIRKKNKQGENHHQRQAAGVFQDLQGLVHVGIVSVHLVKLIFVKLGNASAVDQGDDARR